MAGYGTNLIVSCRGCLFTRWAHDQRYTRHVDGLSVLWDPGLKMCYTELVARVGLFCHWQEAERSLE